MHLNIARCSILPHVGPVVVSTFRVLLFREFFPAFSICYLHLLVCFVSLFKSLSQWMFVCY